jgi:hypothetical protein
MASPIDDTTRKEEAVDFSLRPNLSEHLLTDLEDASSREQLVEQHDFRVQRSPWKSTAEFKSRAEGFGIAPILMSVHRRPFSCEGAPRSSKPIGLATCTTRSSHSGRPGGFDGGIGTT